MRKEWYACDAQTIAICYMLKQISNKFYEEHNTCSKPNLNQKENKTSLKHVKPMCQHSSIEKICVIKIIKV